MPTEARGTAAPLGTGFESDELDIQPQVVIQAVLHRAISRRAQLCTYTLPFNTNY